MREQSKLRNLRRETCVLMPISLIASTPTYGTIRTTQFSIVSSDLFQVKPYPRLDPCTSSAKEVSNELHNLVLEDESTMDVFLRRGEINMASQLALSVLKAIKVAQADCREALNQLQGLRMLVRT